MATTAVIYCRISQDSTREGLGVQRQEEDCRALAAKGGLTVLEVYTDNDTGASSLSRKKRPAYDAMLAAIRAGEAEVILAYSNSRLTRHNLQLEELITLHCETLCGVAAETEGDGLGTAESYIKSDVRFGKNGYVKVQVPRKCLANESKIKVRAMVSGVKSTTKRDVYYDYISPSKFKTPSWTDWLLKG